MSRDPRKQPQPGDVLRRFGVTRHVTGVLQNPTVAAASRVPGTSVLVDGERHVISESDVREVIEELKEEFASARARPVQTPHFAAAGNAADAGIALQLDALALDRLRASPELAEHAAGLADNYDLQRIEARLAGLEHSVSATLSVLSQLLQAVRRDTPATDKSE